jgi:pyruvate dehydrogenase E1 component beta subunit
LRIALDAATAAKADIEVIDLLSLWPWDKAAIAESVARTGRLVTLEEATAGSGWGGEIATATTAEVFGSLVAPPHRITLPDAPVPYNGALETRYLPSPAYVAEQVDALVTHGRAPPPWWREVA